jgi:hypothetical protein
MHSLDYFTQRSAVDENFCWVWSLHITRGGYGKFRCGPKWYQAHRGVYEAVFGRFDAGLTVDHICFNTACINPAHLQLLTLKENQRRQRSAFATYCKSGHLFDEANTYIRPTGQRQCRKCNSLAAQKLNMKKVAA